MLETHINHSGGNQVMLFLATTSPVSFMQAVIHSISWCRKIYVTFVFIILQFLCLNSFAQNNNIPTDLVHYPEFIFHNGQVLTADADTDFTIAEAVAVRGNRIFKVGSDEDIVRLAGPDTRRIDLRGRSLTPGFIYNDGDNSVPAGDILKDSMWNGYTHPHLGGKTLDEALTTLAYVVENEGEPGDPFFFNLLDQWSGTAMKEWDIKTLDEVAPDNPVMVYLSANNGLANSAMLNLAIEKGLPEDHFHLERDTNGEFTGRTGAQVSGYIGREVRAWPAPEWFDEVAMPMAVKSLANYARHGVTVATGHMSAPTMTILNRLFHDQPKDLAVRVYPGLDFLRQNPNGEMYLKRMGNLVDFSLTDERGAMVTIIGASVGPHAGSPDSSTGLLTINPKTNVVPNLSPNTNGYNSWTAQWFTGLTQDQLTEDQLKRTDYYNVILARQHGWNVTGIHNMGGEGIRLAMQNAFEAEQQDNLYVKKLWRPHGFDHNIGWEPGVFDYYESHPVLKDILRFGVNLRIVIRQRDAEPLNLTDVIELQYGMEGLELMAPLKTLQDRGIPFHIEGTEPREGDANPAWYIQKAVTRIDRHGRVIAAAESLDRETAFLALTRWPARFIGSENELGSIAPGMLADLVVFDGNLLEVPIEELADLRPVLTLVGGQVAYESPEL
jgi:predicted amidohydrolase YtcJ